SGSNDAARSQPSARKVYSHKWRQFTHILGRTTLIALLTGVAAFVYVTQRERHPGTQLPYDPEKRTVVILGSGWGATSLLKTIDTTEYNVSRYEAEAKSVDKTVTFEDEFEIYNLANLHTV
ncbi:hypothetical protein MPER_08049, partial [Moniliophthora perniciosa FA553]